MNDLKLYSVDFDGIWPVGSCLIILAKDMEEAKKIAGETIYHTDVFTVEEVDSSKSGVVIFMDGNY